MKKLLPILFAALALILFFFNLGKIPLWSSDEGRFGEIAREMWESKDFIVPHFNYLPYLDKPIFAPFVTSLSYALLGTNAFATRLPIVIFSLLGIFFFYRFTKKNFGKETAAYSSIILLTMIGYVLVGRFAVIDMMMTFFISMTLFCFFTAFQERKKEYYCLAYFLMGLSFLTKGLIGILLPGLIVFTFLAWTKNLRELKQMQIGWGCLILLAVILPWVLAISHKQPEFLKVFIIDQHFTRFATGGFGRRRPLWFFIPIFFALGFPWTFFTPAAIWSGLKHEKSERLKIQFLICWIAVIFFFFSIPKSKLPYYLLPLSMPLAILIGKLFTDRDMLKNSSRLFKGAWHLLAGLSLTAWIGFVIFGGLIKDEKFLFLKTTVVIASPILIGTCLAAYYFFSRRGQLRTAFFLLAGMVYSGMLVTIVSMTSLSSIQSSYAFAEALRPMLKADDQVAVFSSPDRFSDLPFYLKRRIIIVGSDRGTLEAESQSISQAIEQHYFMGEAEYAQSFNTTGARKFCLMEEDRLESLLNQGMKAPKIIRKDGGVLLISNS